jgi:hypothetical protein
MMTPPLSDAPEWSKGQAPKAEYHLITQIHQIIIVASYQTSPIMPPMIQSNTDCARALYPSAQYKMWNEEELRIFLKQNFDDDVLWAFDTLEPYSFKCDLARFGLMYAIGGLYLDLGVRLMAHWNIPLTCGVAAFRDVPFVTRNWATMQTGLIWSVPRRVEFEHAIRFVVENCRRRYYGNGPLYPTGPVVFGRAMLAGMLERGWAEAQDQMIGVCRCITPESEMLNVVYLSQEESLVAFRNKAIAGDLSHLGLAGSNNYNQIWRSRRVYGELEYSWTLSELPSVKPDLVCNEAGLYIPFGTSGHVAWGPYIPLADGTYRATWTFSSDTIGPRIHIDICTDSGESIIRDRLFNSPFLKGGTELSVDFTLDDQKNDVECRVAVFPDFKGWLRSFSIRALDVRRWGHDHPKINVANGVRTGRGCRVKTYVEGLISSGPRISVPKGSYILEVQFATVASRSEGVDIEISANEGRKRIALETVHRGTLLRSTVVRVPFASVEDLRDVEFRVYSKGLFKGVLMGFALFKQLASRTRAGAEK